MIPRRVTSDNDFQGEGGDISRLDGIVWLAHGRGEGSGGSTNGGGGDGKSGGWGEEDFCVGGVGEGDGDMLGEDGGGVALQCVAGGGSGDDGDSVGGSGDGDGSGGSVGDVGIGDGGWGKQVQQVFCGGVVGDGSNGGNGGGNAHLKVLQSTSLDKNLWQSNADLCIGLPLRQFCWSANAFKFRQAGLSSEK